MCAGGGGAHVNQTNKQFTSSMYCSICVPAGVWFVVCASVKVCCLCLCFLSYYCRFNIKHLAQFQDSKQDKFQLDTYAYLFLLYIRTAIFSALNHGKFLKFNPDVFITLKPQQVHISVM